MLSEDSSHLIRSIDGVQKLSAVVEGNKYEKVGTVSLEVHRGFPVHVSITPTCLIIRDNMRRIQYQDTSYNAIFMTQDKARKNTIGYINCNDLQMLKDRWNRGEQLVPRNGWWSEVRPRHVRGHFI